MTLFAVRCRSVDVPGGADDLAAPGTAQCAAAGDKDPLLPRGEARHVREDSAAGSDGGAAAGGGANSRKAAGLNGAGGTGGDENGHSPPNGDDPPQDNSAAACPTGTCEKRYWSCPGNAGFKVPLFPSP